MQVLDFTKEHEAKGKLVVRAKHHGLPGIWVFLSRDTWSRKSEDTGSVYYWSNNQNISSCLFENEHDARKTMSRIKTTMEKVTCVEIVEYQMGKQIFWTDGRMSPS